MPNLIVRRTGLEEPGEKKEKDLPADVAEREEKGRSWPRIGIRVQKKKRSRGPAGKKEKKSSCGF